MCQGAPLKVIWITSNHHNEDGNHPLAWSIEDSSKLPDKIRRNRDCVRIQRSECGMSRRPAWRQLRMPRFRPAMCRPRWMPGARRSCQYDRCECRRRLSAGNGQSCAPSPGLHRLHRHPRGRIRKECRWRSVKGLCDTLEGELHPRPGWRNWQTQRTQNPPTLAVMGVRPPLPAPTKQKVYMQNGLPCVGGHFRQVHVLVHVVSFSACARPAGPGDAFDHRKPVLRRQVAVASRHGDRFVPCGLLNLFNRRPGHCQPGAKGVTV